MEIVPSDDVTREVKADTADAEALPFTLVVSVVISSCTVSISPSVVVTRVVRAFKAEVEALPFTLVVSSVISD